VGILAPIELGLKASTCEIAYFRMLSSWNLRAVWEIPVAMSTTAYLYCVKNLPWCSFCIPSSILFSSTSLVS